LLGGGQRDEPAADRVVQLVLDGVLWVGDRAGLDPEVARVVGAAAEFEADEVLSGV
jgi:hypothetical protein